MAKLTPDSTIPAYQSCPVILALDIIGGKWRIPIIWEIAQASSIRYNELKRRVPGITNIMLTRSLQILADNGMVVRTEYRQIPPHVEYMLTEKCKSVIPALKLLHEWGEAL